jgi:hypothetical protein
MKSIMKSIVKSGITATLSLLVIFTSQVLAAEKEASHPTLKTHTTGQGCEDSTGTSYKENTKMKFLIDGNHYLLECDKKFGNNYQWEVIKSEQSHYSAKVSTDGLGCRDAHGRIYEAGGRFRDDFDGLEYVCREKKELFYFVVFSEPV